MTYSRTQVLLHRYYYFSFLNKIKVVKQFFSGLFTNTLQEILGEEKIKIGTFLIFVNYYLCVETFFYLAIIIIVKILSIVFILS